MDRLGTFYSDLHWKYSGWWAKFLLFILALLRFIPEIVVFGIVSALVSLASTMYSIAGLMRAMFRDPRLWRGFFLLPLFVLALGVASGTLALVAALFAAIFSLFFSADQCEVISRIFLKYGMHRFAYRIALRGRELNAQGHTRAFLSLTCARARGSLKSPLLGPLLAEAMDIASRLRYSSSVHEQRQAARIYNQIAEIFDWVGNEQRAESTRGMARTLNLKLGSEDQLLKHP